MLILTYHKIHHVANFEKQLRYLKSAGYTTLSLSDFRGKVDRQQPLGRKDVLFTFDDGDFSIIEKAMPVLTRNNCPAVVFVITSMIGTNQPFWWDEIASYTNDPAQIKRAKELSNDERLAFLQMLRNQGNVSGSGYRQLTMAELKTLENNNIAVANHSHTHPMFDKLDKPAIEEELLSSSMFLKTNGFSAYDILAYPNGNFTEASERALKALGYKLAFLFDHKVQGQIQNPLRISRLSVNDNTPLWKFKLILSGWHSAMLPVIKIIHKVRS